MKKNLFLLVALLFLPIASTLAQNLDGLTCETAIPVDTSYTGVLPAAGTYYYLASTYDLPITCYYYPISDVTKAPDVYVDFSCTSGVYNDPNVQEMISSAEGWGVEVPIKFTCTRYLDDNNFPYYTLSIPESYRELMTSFNITYDIDAIVAFDAPAAGKVMLRPDTTFKSCMKNSDWLTLPTAINTGVGHEFDSYVWPLMDWKNDSIRLRWTGKEAPATVWVGKTCDFDFSLQDEDVLERFVLNPDAGNEENIRNFNKQDILDYISEYALGGIYYIRVVSAENAELVVEKKPLSPEMQKAIPLQFDQATPVAANATEQVYYFSSEWNKNSILWTSQSSSPLKAYLSSSVTFEADATDLNVFDVYDFVYNGSAYELLLSKKQMDDICKQVTGDHVFVKFVSDRSTKITPVQWNLGYCAERADEMYLNDEVKLAANATNIAWRISADQWAQQDVKLYWKGSGSLKIYLCDTCGGKLSSTPGDVVKYYKEVKVATNGSRDTVTITKDKLQTMAESADADGYLYFRFNNRYAGSLAIVADVAEPIIPDLPAVPTTECSLSSLPLAQGDQVTLNLDSAFTVYRIDYKAWLKSGATLTWNGAEPLHTFVAETCAFALAPYNRYVLAYIPVPAQGNIVLDAAQLAAMEEYVSEDGFLYIRFLTKEEGVLEVK